MYAFNYVKNYIGQECCAKKKLLRPKFSRNDVLDLYFLKKIIEKNLTKRWGRGSRIRTQGRGLFLDRVVGSGYGVVIGGKG